MTGVRWQGPRGWFSFPVEAQLAKATQGHLILVGFEANDSQGRCRGRFQSV